MSASSPDTASNPFLIEDAAFLQQFLDTDLYDPDGNIRRQREAHLNGAGPKSIQVEQSAATASVQAQAPVQAAPVVPPVQQTTQIQPLSPPISQPATTELIKFWGGNQGRWLILVNEPDTETLVDADKELLLKILTAVKKTEQDIALVNMAHYRTTRWGDLSRQFSPTVILTFGMPLTGYAALMMSRRYEVVKGPSDAYRALHADALKQMHGNDQLKRQLWTVLKTIIS